VFQIWLRAGYQFASQVMAERPITAYPNFGTSYALPMHTTARVAVSSIAVNDTSLQWPQPTVIGTGIIHLFYLLPNL